MPKCPRGFQELAELEAMAGRVERELARGRFRPPPARSSPLDRNAAPPHCRPVVPRARHSQERGAKVSIVDRPVFFIGYGHFNQVRHDIEKFPGYGANIIQFEVGPSDLFPKEGVISDVAVRQTRALLDRAARAGVAVNLLISPHYMPQWMLDKYPDMRAKREGFLQDSLHAPKRSGIPQALHRRPAPAAARLPRPAQHLPDQRAVSNAEEPNANGAHDWARLSCVPIMPTSPR